MEERSWVKHKKQQPSAKSYNSEITSKFAELGSQVIEYLLILNEDYKTVGKTVVCAINNTSDQYCRLFEETSQNFKLKPKTNEDVNENQIMDEDCTIGS